MGESLAVFGLGYVGTVSAACLASRGNHVVGVDINPDKVDMFNGGRSPVVEERIGELIEAQVRAGSLRATTQAAEAVASTDMALICVGTPSARGGALSTEHLERVAGQIGAALAGMDKRGYVVAVRSTVFPGTCERIVIPALEGQTGLREEPTCTSASIRSFSAKDRPYGTSSTHPKQSSANSTPKAAPAWQGCTKTFPGSSLPSAHPAR